jgi:hypothetical protein
MGSLLKTNDLSSELIDIKFTLITVDTTSMVNNVFIENHYMFVPHRSSSGDT